jgi:hypothetical protein
MRIRNGIDCHIRRYDDTVDRDAHFGVAAVEQIARTQRLRACIAVERNLRYKRPAASHRHIVDRRRAQYRRRPAAVKCELHLYEVADLSGDGSGHGHVRARRAARDAIPRDGEAHGDEDAHADRERQHGGGNAELPEERATVGVCQHDVPSVER